MWPDVRCCARLSSPENCGGRFLREPVSSPLRPHHPCTLEYTEKCRRVLARWVAQLKKNDPDAKRRQRKLGEIPKRGIPQSERARPLPWDFVLISSDLRDITDSPLDCQPDWYAQIGGSIADITQ